jgi:hypothetical protein
MDYNQYIEAIEKAEEQMYQITLEMRKFERLLNGLHPDHVRATPEFKAVKAASDRAFQLIRAINGKAPAKFKKRRSLERRAKMKQLGAM